MLGGSIQAANVKDKNTYNSDKTSNNYIVLSPQFGIGLKGNWVVGIAPAFTNQVIKNKSIQPGSIYESVSKTHMYTAAAFVRKFYSFNDKAGIYFQLQAGGGKADSKSKTTLNGAVTPGGNSKSSATVLATNLQPGLYFKLTKKVLIESSFGGIEYSHMSAKSSYTAGTKTIKNTIGFTMGSSLTLGISYIF